MPEFHAAPVRLPISAPARRAAVAVAALGASAAVSQLVLFRELLAAFSGNEMTFGIVLGSWLLLAGLGAAAARRFPRGGPRLFAGGLVVLTVLPPLETIAVRILRDVVFLRGSMIGAAETAGATLAVLAPSCLLTGFLLALAGRLFPNDNDARGIGLGYRADTAGGIAGGLLFTFAFAPFLNHFQALFAAGVFAVAGAAALARAAGSRAIAAAGIATGALLAGPLLVGDLDEATIAARFPGRRIVQEIRSPHGHIAITRSGGELAFHENGVVRFTSRGIEAAEEAVHFAMAQWPGAGRAILVSDAFPLALRELEKYPLREIVCVEPDARMIAAARRFFRPALADPRVRIVPGDPRRAVRAAPPGHYDMILLDTADPSTARANRLYTEEFFREAAQALRPGGVLSLAAGAYQNYMSPELARLIAVLHATLKNVFRNVLILPGERMVFLASDNPLEPCVADRLEGARIRTDYLTSSLLTANLSPDRLAEVSRPARAPAPRNTDRRPILHLDSLRLWLAHFRTPWLLILMAPAAALAVWLARAGSVPRAVFATGFAGAVAEVILLLHVQVALGCAYQWAGIVTAAFLLGMAFGAARVARDMSPAAAARGLAMAAGAIALYSILLPSILEAAGRGTLPVPVTAATVILLTAAAGWPVGRAFPRAACAAFAGTVKTAGRLYLADYLGAGAGALLAGTVLVPLAGTTGAAAIAALVAAAGAGEVLLRAGRK
ncbi:MAG: hypothetical protein V1809_10965 [Planctomycetota bacterium]